MKKIFDWTVGSFFRTIGRTIAFFAMAMLVYYLLSYNDIYFGIKNLFFERVKAASVTDGTYTRGVQITTSTTNDVLLSTSSYTPIPSYTVEFPAEFTNVDDDYIKIPFQGTQYFTYDNGGSTTEIGLYEQYIVVKIQSNWNQRSCDIENGIIICPLEKNSSFTKLYFETKITQSFNDGFYRFHIKLPSYADVYKKDSTAIINNQNQNTQDIINSQNQNTQAITNQTQQAQQQHQETMNSSTTDAENDASSFFGNFTVEDQGGLSAIVTAPLNTIRSLLSSTCADLVLPLPFVEEDLTLPCMYSIYSQHFGAFFSLYQTIILGIIAYRCIMSIFFDIKGFTNPNDDRIEVMDL